MSCPNNVAAGAFLMESLVGETSPYRGEGYSTNSGMYISTSAEYGCQMMRNLGVAGLPHSKRDELPPSTVLISGYEHAHYLSQRDAWTTASKTYRGAQPVAQPLHPCSFTSSGVKEEAIPCLYQPEIDSPKESTDSTYIRLGDNSNQTDQSGVSSAGYFRGNQVYTERVHENDGFDTEFSRISRITAPTKTRAVDSFVKRSKSQQDTTGEETNAEEHRADKKLQLSKEDGGPKTDSCTDDSESELK
ncbi:homeobox protein Hox-C10a-like, partial [Clarias magur]